MADLMLLGLFDNVETTADVIDHVRDLGVADDQMDVLSHVPYPARFFAFKSSRLWFLPFTLGGSLTGALVGFFITVLTPNLYPIHVGGQPLVPIPPSAVIFFEFISLFTMVGTFIGFLLQNRFPVLVREMYDELITDGYIGVQVQAEESTAEKVVDVFERHHAHKINRELASEFKSQGIRYLMFWGAVGTGGLAALLAPLLFTYDIVDVPWIDTMHDTVVVGFQEGPRRAAPEPAVAFQGPRLIVGKPGTEPLPATETSLARGKTLFGSHCAICHGETGQGDGPLSIYYTEDHGFPAGVPALAGRDLPGDYIFSTVTNGITGVNPATETEIIKMPSLAENVSPGDTWDIINYINSLEAE